MHADSISFIGKYLVQFATNFSTSSYLNYFSEFVRDLILVIYYLINVLLDTLSRSITTTDFRILYSAFY